MSNKSTVKSPVPRSGKWSKKIIESRNKNGKWKKAMLQGRAEARANPSNMSILRNQRKWRQVDLAEMIGVETPTLTRIERGEGRVSREVASKIAAKLGVPIAKLFAQDGKKFVALIHKPQI